MTKRKISVDRVVLQGKHGVQALGEEGKQKGGNGMNEASEGPSLEVGLSCREVLGCLQEGLGLRASEKVVKGGRSAAVRTGRVSE